LKYQVKEVEVPSQTRMVLMLQLHMEENLDLNQTILMRRKLECGQEIQEYI
jgi:hypothetical protein